MFKVIKSRATGTTLVINKAFKRAVEQTGAVVDGETARALKRSTIGVAEVAGKIGRNLTDLNGDGKVDAEDLKLAAEKAGIAWNKIDPDIKTALLAGGAAGIGVNFIPLIGQLIAVPAFVGTTAYFYLVAKIAGLKK
jgi:hypothetical protein